MFISFKAIVEKIFEKYIITLYTDNGDEYIALKNFLSTNALSSYNTTSHF